MSYPKRELIVDVPFYVALCGEFMPRAAYGEAQTLGRLASVAYTVGIPQREMAVPHHSYRPTRVEYVTRVPWSTQVKLSLGGYEQINPTTQKTAFSLASVQVKYGDKQLIVAKEHAMFGHDGAEPAYPYLVIEGLPDNWDQSIGTLPLDNDCSLSVRSIVADVALRFFNDIAA